MILRVPNTMSHVVCNRKYENLIADFQNFISNNFERNYFDFDSLKQVVSHVHYVMIHQQNWHWSTCSCPFYQKNYFCSHIISVCVTLNLTKIPNNCKNMVAIGEKPKKGRPSKALKALQKQ